MQAALFMEEPGWGRRHQRLALCMAISACVLLFALSLVDWPRFDLKRLIPLELEITLRPPETREDLRPAPPPAETRPLTEAEPPAVVTEPAAPAAVTEPATPAVPSETTAPAQAAEEPEELVTPETPAVTAPSDAPERPVDWYVELERAAAIVGDRAAAEPQSMHPEFDALRRAAAQRYGPPGVAGPRSAWAAEKDSYGRTLLRRGNRYMILDDPSVINEYAFRTFERNMIFFAIPLGKAPPKNLPWVEAIRARYEYLREPDELPPLKGHVQDHSMPADPE